jgi:hypothetical protein
MKKHQLDKQHAVTAFTYLLLAGSIFIYVGCASNSNPASSSQPTAGYTLKGRQMEVSGKPIVEVSGWIEIGQIERDQYGLNDKSGKPTNSTGWKTYHLLHGDTGSNYILQFAKESDLELPAEDRNGSDITLHPTQEFKYKVRGPVFEAETMRPEFRRLASQSMLVVSLQRLK